MINKIFEDALWIRNRIIELAYNAGNNGSHIGGSLSLVEILCCLYSSCNIASDGSDNRNRLILSKGHGAMALYAALERYGALTKSETDTFETNGTKLFAHSSRIVEKGLEFAGGSLSLGVSFSVGVALAAKSRGYDNMIYVIVGDGECDEGLLWEALMAISNFKLNNITVIVDHNRLQSDGFVEEVMDTKPLEEKFKAFGLDTLCVDGHNPEEIMLALQNKTKRPKAIIANTVKGKGVKEMENNPIWHHGLVNDIIYKRALLDLNLMQ